MSKDHFYFSRNDRIVALVLIAVIVILNLIRMRGHDAVTDTESKADSVIQVRKEEPAPKRNASRSGPSADSVRSGSSRTVSSRSTAGYRSRLSSDYKDTVRRREYVNDTVRKYLYVQDNLNVNRYSSKQSPSSPLDLNVLDSAQLVLLPGIGPVFASRIVRYREQLGGFASTMQLTEINGLPDSLMKWFIISDTIPLEKIEVNKGTLNELRRHPYINFYQARAIVELRRERGNIKSPEQLSLLEEFTAQDIERLKPYLDFR